MVLQLKYDYQQGIALRAAAHKIAVQVKRVVADIERSVEEIGTGTAARITKVQLRKLSEVATDFVIVATECRKETDNTTLQLNLEETFLKVQQANITQRRRINTEIRNHPRTEEKYVDLLVALQTLAEINIAQITAISFNKKSEVIADLIYVLTLNAYGEAVRDPDAKNVSVINRVKDPIAGIVLKHMKQLVSSRALPDKVFNEIVENDEAYAKVIEDVVKNAYINIAPDIYAIIKTNADNIFETSSEEYKQLVSHLRTLVDKLIQSPRYFYKPLVQAIVQQTKQPLADMLAEI